MADEAKPEHPFSYACDQTATCHLADMAKVQTGVDFKNTLVVYRKLRVRVLDCRSGKPLKGVPVKEVRIGGKAVVRYKAAHKDWNIAENFPLYEKDGKWFFGLKGGTLAKASQIALRALGFDCGSPSDSYGPQGKTAFLQYRVRRGDIELDEKTTAKIKLFTAKKLDDKWLKLPKKEVLKDVQDADGSEVPFRAPTEDECKEIIAIYNTRCYHAAQYHLATFGYYPGNEDPLADGAMDERDSGEWTEDWIQAFHAWQKVEFGYKEKDCLDWIIRAKEAKKLQDEARNFVTNDHGDIHIPVPVSMLDSEWTLELGLADFAIVAEATLKEQEAAGTKLHRVVTHAVGYDGAPGPRQAKPGRTLFSVEWVAPDGGQKTEWDQPWGWRCGDEPSQSENERKAFKEFRTSCKFTIPAFTADELNNPDKPPRWQDLHQRTKAFSLFYDDELDAPEFVLFALVWCQPVWDGIADPSPGFYTNANVYVETSAGPEDRGRNMHIVTKALKLNGSDPYGNKGYGKIAVLGPAGDYEWRSHQHSGLDIQAVVGANVFAVHGGEAKRSGSLQADPNHPSQYANDGGQMVVVDWSGEGQTSITYLHLSQYVAADKAHVRAGEIVGLAGRTGNLSLREATGQPSPSDNPGHTHLNMGAEEHRTRLENAPDEDNRICIPTNRTPLLFPCRCEVTAANSDPKDCKFEDKTFTKTCWAVAELKCPYMASAGRTNFRLQAQLRYLNENLGAPYLSPGDPDGDLGNVPTAGAFISKTRRAIRAFRIDRGLTPEDAKPHEGCEMDDAAWNALEQLAPITEPES